VKYELIYHASYGGRIENLTIAVSGLGWSGPYITACDNGKFVSNQGNKLTYSRCLLSAVASGGELEADDRALCAEATGVTEPTYKYEQNRMVPSNDFTQCYDTQKKELQAKAVAQADRLAKLSCKYPD